MEEKYKYIIIGIVASFCLSIVFYYLYKYIVNSNKSSVEIAIEKKENIYKQQQLADLEMAKIQRPILLFE